MVSPSKGRLLEFKSTYSATLKEISASSFLFTISGTLDGFLDLAVTESSGKHRTYNISCDEAEKIAKALLTVAEDIKKYCLYDRDSLLETRNV